MKLRFLLPFLVLACQPAQDPQVAQWEAQAENVTIIRDDFGVPHIYGKTDADAVFGMLYAQAEDDFRRIERNYIWATGRLAELEGIDAIYSDVRANMYMTEAEARAAYDTAPDWLKALCVAFADGLNYYLHTHPEVEPRVITNYEPWMPMFFSEGSIGGDIEAISTRRIRAFYEEDAAEIGWNEFGDGLHHPDPYDEPKGSNGIAVSGELTASGNAMLLINPHTSFYFRPEVHVVSEEGLNAYGAVTWGQFFIYQGFNEKTGWMHTSTYVDFIDEYVQDVTETDGRFTYAYGDETRDVMVQEVNLKYIDGDSLREVSYPIYRTHHGPVTHKVDGKWVVTKINWDPVNALIQSYTRTKLDNYAAFREMMDIRTNSSNNTVYADADGNIAYFHGNFIPKRNDGFDFSRPVDGSDPATDWIGLHTVDESITLLNPGTGWIQNTNSTPFTAAGAFSPKREDYPPYMAPDSENYRAIHAVKVLEKADSLTLDGLIALAYDPYITAFEDLVPPLLAAYDRIGSRYSQLSEVIAVLRDWDYSTSVESVGMSIGHFYGMEFSRSIGNINGLIPFNAPSTTRERMTDTAQLDALSAAVTKLTEDFGTWNTPWGEINRFQRLSGDINLEFDDDQPSIAVGMASGRWGALASYGASARENTKRIYGTSGNSFVAVVEFGDRVKAKSILAGGNSGDPASPHFYDQAQRYADHNFKDVAFYREDVEARARRTYKPGQK